MLMLHLVIYFMITHIINTQSSFCSNNEDCGSDDIKTDGERNIPKNSHVNGAVSMLLYVKFFIKHISTCFFCFKIFTLFSNVIIYFVSLLAMDTYCSLLFVHR